ncbi:MAG: heat-shock protein [Kordiimonas sp.]|mgnify:CR=1 FL=1|nr:heat-shock protein [Kordiimonas sp.]|tara:strand:- start:999 stop:1463 length:465 start_codon:yes stop_codon:yes gene_type:complete
MRTLDLSPLLRSSVGFDQLNRLFDTVNAKEEVAYPPYNIEKLSENDYRITMALAGFSTDELDISLNDGVLIIAGKAKEDNDTESHFIHRGIAKRAFERHFKLAETIRVQGANFENGLLNIELKREIPEHMKPRQIEIDTAAGPQKITDANESAA